MNMNDHTNVLSLYFFFTNKDISTLLHVKELFLYTHKPPELYYFVSNYNIGKKQKQRKILNTGNIDIYAFIG